MKYFNRIIVHIFTGYLLLTTLAASTANAGENESDITEKLILGWIENIYLQPSGMKTKAKLDTGAKTSSIHAKNIEHFEKDGEPWVRFQFASNTKLKEEKYTNGKSKKVVTLEAPITRRALIKRHKHTSLERPVVELPFTIAGVEYTAEFTLTDRSKFLYPVLLGRRFLKHVAIVDPGNTFLKTRTQPKIDPEPEPEPANNKNDKAEDA
ncbi:MAG: hypothetical protein CMK89_06900 [Pseudomonadales bacterium]|nr:hypothetical protein [Pseudomonadales bacterium]RLU04128.1 MAG: ATP-dependent zinc protease [Ketobacter sp.]